MAVNRDLSKFANHIFAHENGNIGLATDSTTFVGVGTDNPTTKLDVSGDLKVSANTQLSNVNAGFATFSNVYVQDSLGVSGVTTFGSDVVFNGSVVYTGIATFNNAIADNINVDNLTVNDNLTSPNIFVNETIITYNGILVGVSTNIISETQTDNIEIGFLVSGSNISAGSTVAGIGTSTITLSLNSTNNIITLQKIAIYENINGNIIVGIDTSNIQVGYGISSNYISVGTTVSQIGISSITLSQNATNPYEKVIREGTLSGVSTSIITGIDTSGIFVNQVVFGDFITFNTSVLEILPGEIVLNQNAFNSGINTSNYQFYFTDTFILSSQEALTISNFQYRKPFSGIGTISNLSGSSLQYSSGSISSISGQSLNYATASINSLNVDSISLNFIEVSSSNIPTLYGNELQYNVGIVTEITGTNISYSGVGTIANIQGENLNFSGIGSVSSLNVFGDANISGIITSNSVNSGVGSFQSLLVNSSIIIGNNEIGDNIRGNELQYNVGIITELSGTNISYSGVGTITNLQGETINYTGIATFGSNVNIDGDLNLSFGNLNIQSGILTSASINSEVLQTTQLNADNTDIQNITSENLSSAVGIITELSGTNISYSGVGTITNLQGETINYTGIATFGSFVDIGGDLRVQSGVVTSSQLYSISGYIENLDSTYANIENILGDKLVATELSGTNISYSGVGTITNLQGESINYTGVSTFNDVGITTLNAVDGTIQYLNITSNLTVTDLTVGVVTSNLVDTNDITSPNATISNINGENANYSGIGTFSNIITVDLNSTNINGENINLSGISTVIDIQSTYITNSQDFITDYLYSNVGVITALSGNEITYNVGQINEISGTNISYSGIGTIENFNSTVSNISNLLGENSNFSGISTVETLDSTQIVNSEDIVSNRVFSSIGVVTTLSGNSIDYEFGDINNLNGTNLNYSGIATLGNVSLNNILLDNVQGSNANFTGVSTFNVVGVTSLTSDSIFASSGIITSLTGRTLSYSDNASLADVRIGIGNTALVVEGNAKVTGILTIGQNSVTINGITNEVYGISTITSNIGNISTISGSDAIYTNVNLDLLSFSGINTSNNYETTINIQPSQSGFSTSYTLTLPAQLGIPGQVLTLLNDGNLGFTTSGLYENRIYVSSVNGSDSNDGKSQPVKTIKRAAQLASFESFVLPGGRYIDAANLLEDNKDFIAAEVVGFVTTTYPTILSNPDYDENICKRDIGFIVDALSYDLTYGGNSKSVEAGLAYWNAGTSYVDGESVETIAGYNHIITISKYIINNINIPQSYQGIQTVFQSTDLTIAYDDSCNNSAYNENCCSNVWSAIGNYVGIITSIIGIGTTAAPEVSLPTSKSTPVAVFVEAGEYVEDNPIILYEDVAVIGDNLRNTIIRPLNSGKDLFRVRNGCYLTGFAMKDYADAAGVPQFTFDYAVAFDDPSDTTTSRLGYAIKTSKPIITRSPYIQNCSILSFLGGNGILVDGSKVDTLNTPVIRQEGENPVEGDQPEQGKSMVAAAFTMVSFGGIGWRVINDGYSQVVSCFQIFCRYGSLAQSGGYLSITNSATNFGLYALRSTGYNSRSYVFDRGIIAATGTSGGLQTLKVVGLGRSDQDLYVLRFLDHGGTDQTANFKLAATIREVDISVGVNTVSDTIGIQTHGFNTGDSVIYQGNEGTIPPQIIGGLVNLNEYFVEYVSDDEFRLYEDDSLSRRVDLTSVTSGINTFIKGNQEFFNFEKLNAHTSYQRISFASTTSNLTFISGREVTQTVNGGTAVGIAYTYDSSNNELIVSVEAPGGVRNNFGVTGVGVNDFIQDHSGSPVSAAATSISGIATYHTVEFKVDCTQTGSQILGIGGLPENYKVHFHRPSIVNSSSHTWEFSGSGIDYNALPQNGGKTRTETEQVFSQGGRVYSSGTNELGDFKIGNFITAYNRTGNIIFNNKVSIGQLDSLRLSLSGGVAVEEFSTDIGLGDNEVGGAQDYRISTQKAVRTFLNNRLGNFIDKDLSTNAVPSAVVQLNAFGQINPDLIPPKVVNYYTADVGGGRTTLVDRIPPVDLRNGDTVVEPDFSYVLISDIYGQYLILSDSNRNYNFNNGDEVVSAVSDGGAIGIVTTPTSVGYGNTGLVKGVLLNASIVSGGSGYTNPGIYTSIPLSNTITGAGTSARANITVGASGTVTNVSVVYGGRYYDEGNLLSVANSNDIGGRSGGSEFQVSVGSVETRLYIQLTNNQKFTGSYLLSDFIQDGDAVGLSTTLTANYTVSFNPTSTATGGSIDFDNDRIVVGINSFSDGDSVVYSAEGGNVLEDLISGEIYYVKRVGISSIELYTNYALSTKKDFLSNGSGTQTLTRRTINIINNKITIPNHGYSSGDAVRVSGNVPTGINTGSFYFLGSITTNSFSLHATQAAALSSVNGLIFNPVNITAVGTGTLTLTKQNVQYSSTVNTSSNLIDNWTVLSSGTIDAANITSGTISPSRLGSGTANSDTFLGGDSVYRKAVKSVGIGTTTPVTITSSSFEIDNGVTKHFGDLRIDLQRVESTLDNFSTLGIARFKSSTFEIGSDGAVSIKNSQLGDVDAATFGGFSPAYYLDINNSTGSLPINRGGTGLSALPSEGFMLVGNGSAYTLTGSPTIAGTLTGEVTIKSGGDIELPTGTWTGEKSAKIQNHANNLYLQYTTHLIGRNSAGTNRLILTSAGNLTLGGTVTGTRLISNVANGTAPLSVTSSTVVTNLNADLVDGIQGASLLRSDANDTFSGTLTYSGTGTALNFTSTSEVILADHSSNSTSVPFDIRKSGSSLNDSSGYGILHLSRLNHNNSATSAGASLYFQLRDSGGTLREYAGISGQKTEAGAAGGRLQFYRYGRTSLGYWDSTGLYVGSNKVWHAGNDGSGTGLDADTVDGLQATSFLRSDADDSFSGTITGNKLYVGGSALTPASSASLQVNGFIRTGGIFLHTGGNNPNNTLISYRLYTRNDGTLEWGTSDTVGNNNKIWHQGNDGTGSGLDADLLDGQQSSYYINTDTTAQSKTGKLWASYGNTNMGGYSWVNAAFTTNSIEIVNNNGTVTTSSPTLAFHRYGSGGPQFRLDATGTNILYLESANAGSARSATAQGSTYFASLRLTSSDTNGIYINSNKVWHAGNDGSGSGLDADTLDGLNSTSFLRSDANSTLTGTINLTQNPVGTTYGSGVSSTPPNKISQTVGNDDGWRLYGESASTNSVRMVFEVIDDIETVGYEWLFRNKKNYGDYAATEPFRISGAGAAFINGNTVWHAGNDGPGSGLDADTLDGVNSVSFLRSDANDSASGVIDFLGGSSDTPAIRIKSGGNSWSQGLAIHPSADSGFALAFFRTSATLTTNTNTWAIGNLGTNGTNNFGLLRNGLTGGAGIISNAIFDVTQAGVLRFGFTPTVGSNTIWHAGNDGAGSGLDADTVDGYHFLQTQGISAVGNFGQWQGHGTYNNFNSFVNYWGWNYVQGNTNAPNTSSSQWYRNRVSLGSEYGLNYFSGHYWLEMAYPRSSQNTAGHMWLRVCENGSVGSWTQVGSYIGGNVTWHAGNDGAGSGLDADNLDGYTWTSSGKNVRATEFYADNWFRNYNSGEGLYNEATAMHWYSDANWRWRLYGTSSSAAILFATNGNTTRGYLYADTASSIGFLNTGGQWGLRYLSNDGNSPNLYFLEEGNETWTGNPGNDQGKIEYHSNRFYIASGSNSTEIARFRQSGTDRVIINNNGEITINGNTVWHAGNDGSGSGLDADTVDGYQASSLANSTHTPTSQKVNLAVGWYTIAVNAGDRAVARFGVRDTQSGRHQSVIFYASHNYGNFSKLTVLHSSRYSGNPFRYIRIKEGSTYDGALLQVYVDDSGNALTAYLLGDNFQSSGWIIKDWIPDGTNPGNVNNFGALTNVAAQIDLDNILDGGMATTGQIYAGGDTTQYKVWHAGNDGSGSGLDADLLDGLQLHTGRNNEANKVVRTDGNGYIQAGWINTTSGAMNRTLPNRIYMSNDGYIRYNDLNYSKAHLGGTYKYGNSRPNITADSNYWVGTMGWGTTDMNSVFDWGSGFIDSWSNPANQPSGTSHWVGVQAEHYTNGSNRYGWQMVGGPIGNLRFRNTWPGFSSWKTVPVLDVNNNNGGAMYAGIYYDSNSTGYYTDPASTSRMNQIQANTYYSPYSGANSGLPRSSYPYGWGFQEGGAWSNPYPDLVLQYHTGVTLAANANYEGISFDADYNDGTLRYRIGGGSGYSYKYYWQYTNASGYYSGDYSWHISPNDLSSYGSMRLRGSKNGWYGMAIDTGNRPHVMFDGSGNGGFYNQDGGRWHHYYSQGNNCIGMCGSTTSSSYGLYVSKGIYSTGTIYAASDARVKTDIKTIENALEKVNQLRGVTFKKTNRPENDPLSGKTEMGVIAQEINEIVPEVVNYAEDVDEYAVSYGNLAGLFIEAMKEQTKIINSLKEEVAKLKNMLGE